MIQKSEILVLDTALDPGHAVYAIGDVHGMHDPFRRLLEEFEKDGRNYDRSTLVLLGDLVDRGPDSPRVMDSALEAEEMFSEVSYLMGNHEAMMKLFTSGRDPRLWYLNGGGDTLKQFGVVVSHDPDALEKIGWNRLSLLDRMKTHHEEGNLFFVHAGTSEEEDLEEFLEIPWHCMEDEWHWAWIRWPFLQSKNPLHGRTVVHGHTPVQYSDPEKDRHLSLPSWHFEDEGKINLDAFSYRSKHLAGAVFSTDSYQTVVTD